MCHIGTAPLNVKAPLRIYFISQYRPPAMPRPRRTKSAFANAVRHAPTRFRIITVVP